MRYQEIAERKKKKKKKKSKQLRVGGWFGFTGSSEETGDGGGVEESKYLSGTDKVANISPVLGSKPKKQKKLMNKFFGSS